MRISDLSSDVCSSDLADLSQLLSIAVQHPIGIDAAATADRRLSARQQDGLWLFEIQPAVQPAADPRPYVRPHARTRRRRRLQGAAAEQGRLDQTRDRPKSEEHTSELQSLMRISYADFCLQKKNNSIN